MGGAGQVRSLRFSDRVIEYELVRGRFKNINLRVRADGSVRVSAHHRVPIGAIEGFVLSKEGFVVRAMDRRTKAGLLADSAQRDYVSGETVPYLGRELRLVVSEGKRNGVELREENGAGEGGGLLCLFVKDPGDRALRERTLKRWLDAESRRLLLAAVADAYPRASGHGIPEPKVAFRDMRSRWGSCQPRSGKVTLNKRLLGAPPECIEYVVMHELAHFVHANHSKAFYDFLAVLMPDWRESRARLGRL